MLALNAAMIKIGDLMLGHDEEQLPGKP
jgi:hypothetical protein